MTFIGLMGGNTRSLPKGLRKKTFPLVLPHQGETEGIVKTPQGRVWVVRDPVLKCGRYLQDHLLRVPVRTQVLQEAKGPLPAALLLLILNRDVQLGHLRGAVRNVDVIGHGPGDGRDYHHDDGDGDHENGGRRQAGGFFRPGAPSQEG